MLAALLAGDAVFVAFHLLHRAADGPADTFADPSFLLNTEGGYSEWFGYAKAALAVILLLRAFARRREPVLLGWAFAWLVVGLDDALGIHERGGTRLEALGLEGVSPLRAQDVGELLTWSVLAVLVGAAVVVTQLRSARHTRRESLTFLSLLAALVVFGVVVDMVEVATSARATTVVEDGGELVVMSAVVAAACVAVRRWSPSGSRSVSASRWFVPRPRGG